MGNLVRKGFLAFDTSATAYLYSAAVPAEQVAGRLLDEIVAQLWRGDGGPALAHLLGPHLEIRHRGPVGAGRLRRSAAESSALRRQTAPCAGTRRAGQVAVMCRARAAAAVRLCCRSSLSNPPQARWIPPAPLHPPPQLWPHEADNSGATSQGEVEAQRTAMALDNQRAITAKDVLLVSLGLVGLVALYPLSDRLFDMACELAFVIGAVSVLEMARKLRWFVSDDYPLFLATSVAFVAALQLAHAAADPRLALLGAGDSNLGEQLQLASGIVLGVAMCIAPWLAGRRLRFVPWLGAFALGCGVLLAAIYWWHVFPSAIQADGSASSTTQVIDVLVAGALCAAGALTYRQRRRLNPALARAVEVALLCAAVGWLLRIFLPSDDITRLTSVLFIALVYIAVAENGLARPTALMVSDLKEHDEQATRERGQALSQLRLSEERYRTVFDQSPAGLLLFDSELIVTRCNARLSELFHNPEEAIVGYDLHSLSEPGLAAAIGAARDGALGVFEGRFENPFNEGKELWISARTAPLFDACGRPAGGVGIIVDLTESKRAEELIERLAFNDTLTGLANRTQLRDRLRAALLGVARAHWQVAVLYVDLDRFAAVNDLVGHAGADRVLQEVAARLAPLVRATDTLARWGGDEFVVLLGDVNGEEAATRVAEQIAAALAAPWRIDGRQFALSASLGLAVAPHDGSDAETLLEHVAIAARRAKAAGGATFRFYDAEMGREVSERVRLEAELRLALERHEFVLYYQPQVDLARNEITGVEALVRWQHPQRGLLPPAAFLGLAESTGLIEQLTAWVVDEACGQAAAWRDQGAPQLRMAVNLSARDFRSERVVGVVAGALERSGLAPSLLEVELTETAIVEDGAATARQLEALQDLGVTVALDDFGTGYSSLSHLRTLPISRVKIDRSFVSQVSDERRSAAIVGAMVDLIHSLGLEAIAEGIETQEDLNFLRGYACDLGQGYLFSRPIPAGECAKLLGCDLIVASV
jgi:diguanylate cyclase (GGDEF)-like protein/PAS domain S-box-containing protein